MNSYIMDEIPNLSEAYLARCIKTLKEWTAPLNDWYCTEVIDMCEDDEDSPLAECELCGCKNVRYVHRMEHQVYFEYVDVGCICAGIMEGDVLRAKERDRLMKNRSKRRRTFTKKKWKEIRCNVYMRRYNSKELYIFRNGDYYGVNVGSRYVWKYKGKPINNFISAMYAAFDMADPVEEIWKKR